MSSCTIGGGSTVRRSRPSGPARAARGCWRILNEYLVLALGSGDGRIGGVPSPIFANGDEIDTGVPSDEGLLDVVALNGTSCTSVRPTICESEGRGGGRKELSKNQFTISASLKNLRVKISSVRRFSLLGPFCIYRVENIGNANCPG